MIKLVMSSSLIFCLVFYISSSSSRFIGGVDQPSAALGQLRMEALRGNFVSSCAYELYTDLSIKKKSGHLANELAKRKLINIGLCVIVDGSFKVREFYISDRLNKIDSPKKMGDPSEK